MSIPPVQIVYGIHTLVFDVELQDTHTCEYRTASGRLRPFLTFVFAPLASLMVAFRLTADRPDRRTLSALLYTAMTHPADQPYGGVPDEIQLYERAASFASPLQRVCDTLGILLRSPTSRYPATGEEVLIYPTLLFPYRRASRFFFRTRGYAQH